SGTLSMLTAPCSCSRSNASTQGSLGSTSISTCGSALSVTMGASAGCSSSVWAKMLSRSISSGDVMSAFNQSGISSTGGGCEITSINGGCSGVAGAESVGGGPTCSSSQSGSSAGTGGASGSYSSISGSSGCCAAISV